MVLKNLILAAEEAILAKISKWNEKILYVAAYVDPMMRTQIDALMEWSDIDMNKVRVYLIPFYYQFLD